MDAPIRILRMGLKFEDGEIVGDKDQLLLRGDLLVQASVNAERIELSCWSLSDLAADRTRGRYGVWPLTPGSNFLQVMQQITAAVEQITAQPQAA
jgi:hypothetical protein